MMLEGLGPLSNDEEVTAEKLQEALTPRYRHEDRDRLKVFVRGRRGCSAVGAGLLEGLNRGSTTS